MPATPVVSNARKRVHEAVRADIVAEARRQLAVTGAASLSLRAVARELGMASSAMYRYFRSRDELLTALIIESYNALGGVAEAAARTGGTAFERLRSVARAVRAWALEHPHEYGLLYGTPVPGYHAPELTLDPASRVTRVLAGIVSDAYQAGELTGPAPPPPTEAMAAQARPAREALMPAVPLPVAARALVMWALLFGQTSFEVSGRLQGVVQDSEVLFDYAVATMGDMLGFSPRN